MILQRIATLSRQRKSDIVITLEDDRTIVVRLIKTRGRVVTLGVIAPTTVCVDRREVAEARTAVLNQQEVGSCDCLEWCGP